MIGFIKNLFSNKTNQNQKQKTDNKCNHQFVNYYIENSDLIDEYLKVKKEWKISISNGALKRSDFEHIAGVSLPKNNLINQICWLCDYKNMQYDNFLQAEIIRMNREIFINKKTYTTWMNQYNG